MDIAERIRRARFVQTLCAVIGALAGLIVVVESARTQADVALVAGILLAVALLFLARRELADLLRRHRRDTLFLFLGTLIGAAGMSFWTSPSLPASSSDVPELEATTPTPTPDFDEISSPTPISEDSSEIVYRTPKGEKYHRATCRHVKGKEIPLTLSEAKKIGLMPCKVCNPPPLP